jgi:hypothetical protein
MKNILNVLLLSASLIGCGSTTANVKPSAPPPTTSINTQLPQPKQETEEDQYRFIEKDNWKISVPANYIDAGDSDGVEFNLKSLDGNVYLLFGVFDTEQSLDDYAVSVAVVMKAKRGVEILDARKGTVNGKDTVLLVMGEDRGIILHFVIVDKSKSYNFSCMMSKSVFKEEQNTCIKVVKSLEIK